MAITDENTVLIIGAGASVLFGMPLGGGLMESIRKQITSEREILKKVAENNFHGSIAKHLTASVRNNSNIETVPITSVLYSKYSDGLENQDFADQRTLLQNLIILLSDQTSETIDDFIVENPTYADLTKISIAAIFFKTLYQKNDNQIYLKSLGKREFYKRRVPTEIGIDSLGHPERNWVHLLINIIRQGIRSGKVSPTNKVQIITFNYDVILEKILDTQFSNSEKMSGKVWTDYIEIIHPHGKCDPLPDSITNATNIISKWASGIYVVQESEENLPKEVIAERNRAKEIVLQSREIYAAGFSFSAPNCRLLGMQNPWDNLGVFTKESSFHRHFRFCNYDGNFGVSRKVKEFEHIAANEWTSNLVEEQAGSPEKPLTVADWIRMGVLGELPG